MNVQYKEGTQKFVNPYHFVPLEGDCDKKYDYNAIKHSSGLLTGWIECELETKSPIFIPNSSNDDVWGKRNGNDQVKSYDFASYEDLAGRSNPAEPKEPIIPGSELRGVIRSAFEAVTKSCLSTTDHERPLFKRTPVPNKDYGRLIKEDNTWYIQPCTRMKVNMNHHHSELIKLDEGEKVRFRGTKGKVYSLGAGQTGYYHEGENCENKNNESIFAERGSRIKLPNADDVLDSLLMNFRLYQNPSVNQKYDDTGKEHSGYSYMRKDATKNDLEGALIYYHTYNGKYYLSPAAIGREVFFSRLDDILRNQGNYSPCDDASKLCPACALFGFVNGDHSVSGRVRFCDAEFVGSSSPKVFMDPLVLPELASPQTSATEFYLERPKNAQLWNYDYAGNWEGKRFDTSAYKDYKAKIKGRKYFWHDTTEKDPGLKLAGGMTKRNVMVRPMRSGGKFKFKVFFNGILADELKKLVWVLSIDGMNDHGHKIGMGKPIGMGSVCIKVLDVKERKVSLDVTSCYEIHSRKDFVEIAKGLFDMRQPDVMAFLKITQLNPKLGTAIDYPHLESGVEDDWEASYKWFIGNKQIVGTGGTGTSPVIKQSLPKIETPTLKKIVEAVGEKN